jgi:hypothetical protein
LHDVGRESWISMVGAPRPILVIPLREIPVRKLRAQI